MECIATDSYRLAKQVIKLNQIYSDTINIVIPCKNILELMKIHNKKQCKDNANQVEWKIKANITIFYLRVHDASLRTHLFCNTPPFTW